MADFVSLDACAKVLRGSIDVTSATIRCICVGPSFDGTDEDEYVGDITTLDECSVSGYTAGHGEAGRLQLSTITGNEDWTNNEYEWSAATFGWTLAAGFTVNGVLLAIEGTSNDTDAQVIRFMDLTDTATNGGRITVTPATFLKVTYS